MGKTLPNLQAQRLIAGYSSDELARRSNTSDALVQRMEVGGECSGDEADRIAAALGVTLVTLGALDL